MKRNLENFSCNLTGNGVAGCGRAWPYWGTSFLGGGLSTGQIGEELHFSNCPAILRIRFSLRNPPPNDPLGKRAGEFHVENDVFLYI